MIKPASNEAEASLHGEIRKHVASFPDQKARMSFLEQNGADLVVASALLEAPPFLSNLTEPELELLRHKVEVAAFPPEIIEAKGKLMKAIAELERAHRAAPELIAACAGMKPTDLPPASLPKPKGERLPKLKETLPKLKEPKATGRLPSRGTLSDDNPPKGASPKAVAPNWPHNAGSPSLPEGGPSWT